MRRGSAVIAVGKKLTTIHLPAASSALAVGVDLMVRFVLQRDHVSRSDLASDLERIHLQVTGGSV